MRSGTIVESHQNDDQGRPAGGTSSATGIAVQWQDGPLGRGEERVPANGAFVEDVVAIAIGRIRFYQVSEFACDENARALEHLEAAARDLDSRTQRRESEGTEGTHAGV